MPPDGSQTSYYCKSCAALLRPEPGECCIFCSYGSVMCPPARKMWKAIAKAFD